MIETSRLDGSRLIINAELIEVIEVTPDTVISLVSNKKLVVRESAEELVRSVIEYKQRILAGVQPVPTKSAVTADEEA